MVEPPVGDGPARDGPAGGARAVRVERDPDRVPPWLTRAILLFLTGVAGLYISYRLTVRLRGLLVLLLVALFLSLAMEPAVNALARRGWKRANATALVFGGVIIATVLFVALIGSLLVTQVTDVVVDVPAYSRQAVRWLNATFGLDLSGSELAQQIQANETFRGFTRGLASTALAAGTSLLGLVFQAFTVGLFAFYLTADGPRFRRSVCSAVPPVRQRQVLHVWELAIDMTGGFIYSRGLLALFSAVAHFVVLLVLGVPNALVLAIWVGLVSQFVPTVGTYLAAVLPLLAALAVEPLDALWLLLFVVVYQNLEAYVLSPRVTSRTLALNPAVAFAAVLAGAAVLGGVGAVLALPAAAVVQAVVVAYSHRYEVVDAPLTADVAVEPERETPATHRGSPGQA